MFGLRAKISLFNGISGWRVYADSEVVHFPPQRILFISIRLLSRERQELLMFDGFKMLIEKISLWVFKRERNKSMNHLG